VNRKEKENLVVALHDDFEGMNLIVVTHYSGLTVSELSDLRARMRDFGASFKITKNSLARLAVKEGKFDGLSDMFSGPTAIAFSNDPVSAAKITVQFAKENSKLVVLGGALNGELLDLTAVRKLAELPSLEALRAKIVGLINAPSSKLVRMIGAPANQLNSIISQFSNKDGNPG